MAAPEWYTEAGSLGTFPANTKLSIALFASAVLPAGSLKFNIVSGSLPIGTHDDPISMSTQGIILGTLDAVEKETEYKFTVRITDENGNIKDRTFSVTITNPTSPKFTTPQGEIVSVEDSTYIDFDLQYDNPIDTNIVYITLSSGSLPPGVYLTEQGKITGYPAPPTLSNRSPITKSYTFSVQLFSHYGSDSATYTITVSNQRLHKPPHTRPPVILNNRPLRYPIPLQDPYYDFYSGDVPVIESGRYFSFKVIGHDFDKDKIVYNFGNLPPGLIGDSTTGWVTGTPTLNTEGIMKFNFIVTVAKENNPLIYSELETFSLYVTKTVRQDIVWNTDSDLGVIHNGTISNTYVNASSEVSLSYRLEQGSLPPNIRLLRNGELSGRIPFQPTNKMLEEGATTIYTFTITAYSEQYDLVANSKEFTWTVLQYNPIPLENVYIKASSDLTSRKTINNLLTDTTLIPYEYLYRSEDPFFGKASDVRFTHAYGIPVSALESYISAVQQNHYTRKLILGPLQTAIARDDNNNIIYEVVYSPIIDNLTNSEGKGPKSPMKLPRKVTLTQNGYTSNNGKLFTTESEIYTSYSPEYVRDVYPGSLINMRNQLASVLGQNTDVNLLPKWMTSQQLDGDTLGYVQAWVVCYTLPGYSETIMNNINDNWGHTLNEIDFTVDRYIVDKSASYDWNNNLTIPTWGQLPSATPAPNPLNKNDITILFPRETILPRNIV